MATFAAMRTFLGGLLLASLLSPGAAAGVLGPTECGTCPAESSAQARPPRQRVSVAPNGAAYMANGQAILGKETVLMQLTAGERTRRAGPAMEEAKPAAWDSPPKSDFVFKDCVAEFLAMTLFVFIGCGSAASVAKTPGSAWVLQVSFTFGIAITVLAYTLGHYSGGHINCAVTLGLVIVGNTSVVQGIGNLVAQLMGSLLGAFILWLACSGAPAESLDQTGGLGTNTLGPGVPAISALIYEIVGTFLLMFTVLETAVNKDNSVGNMAPLAIGFAVFLAHSVLINIDGCSINPTRTTGPAIVNALTNPKSDGAALRQLWIFWVGPLAGAALAAGAYKGMGLM